MKPWKNRCGVGRELKMSNYCLTPETVSRVFVLFQPKAFNNFKSELTPLSFQLFFAPWSIHFLIESISFPGSCSLVQTNK